jgi:hypothetical protein
LRTLLPRPLGVSASSVSFLTLRLLADLSANSEKIVSENRCRFALWSRLTVKCTRSRDPALFYHGIPKPLASILAGCNLSRRGV